MADNYLEYQALDMAKRKAKKERELQLKRNRYLEAYRKQLQDQKTKSQNEKNT